MAASLKRKILIAFALTGILLVSVLVSVVLYIDLNKSKWVEELYAPSSRDVKAGEKVNFVYLTTNNISVDYNLSNNIHKIEVIVNSNRTMIERNVTDKSGVSISERDNIHLYIYPISRKANYEGEIIPFYEDNWNVTEIRVEVWK